MGACRLSLQSYSSGLTQDRVKIVKIAQAQSVLAVAQEAIPPSDPGGRAAWAFSGEMYQHNMHYMHRCRVASPAPGEEVMKLSGKTTTSTHLLVALPATHSYALPRPSNKHDTA